MKIKTRQIRLISPLSGGEDSRIRCRRDSAVLSEAPIYEALLYEWGDHNYNKPDPAISINRRRFIVLPNLWLALKRLRDPSKERALWIDAICLNQDDEDEKAIQIGQMGRVYSQAVGVVIWLGLADPESDLALEFLHRLATQPHIDDETIKLLITANPTQRAIQA